MLRMCKCIEQYTILEPWAADVWIMLHGPAPQTDDGSLSFDKGCKKCGDFVSVKLLIQSEDLFVGVISTLIKISARGSRQKEAKDRRPVCKSDINLTRSLKHFYLDISSHINAILKTFVSNVYNVNIWRGSGARHNIVVMTWKWGS